MIFTPVQARSTLAKRKESKSVIERAGEEVSPVNLKDGTTTDDVDKTFGKSAWGPPTTGVPSPLYLSSFSTRISTVFPMMIFR